MITVMSAIQCQSQQILWYFIALVCDMSLVRVWCTSMQSYMIKDVNRNSMGDVPYRVTEGPIIPAHTQTCYFGFCVPLWVMVLTWNLTQ